MLIFCYWFCRIALTDTAIPSVVPEGVAKKRDTVPPSPSVQKRAKRHQKLEADQYIQQTLNENGKNGPGTLFRHVLLIHTNLTY